MFVTHNAPLVIFRLIQQILKDASSVMHPINTVKHALIFKHVIVAYRIFTSMKIYAINNVLMIFRYKILTHGNVILAQLIA